jgi:ubiquinone/menaquinone biosynthesis C-methylase UbiE
MARHDQESDERVPVERVFQSQGETRAFYTKISRFYDRLSERSEAPVRKRGLELLAAAPGDLVVEVGFGTGHGLAALRESVGGEGRVVGFDLSEGMILQARRNLQGSPAGDSALLACGNALELPLADGLADAMFSSFTLELFDTPDIPRALAEWRRVLRPGGRLVVVSLSKRPNELAVKAFEWSHRHFPNFVDCRPIYVEDALREAGFAIERGILEHMWVPVEIVLATRHSPPIP